MGTFSEYFTLGNLASSLFTGILTSLLIWVFVTYQNRQLGNRNNEILGGVLYQFMILIGISKKAETVVFELMQSTQEKINIFKNRADIDYEWLCADVVANLKLLKAKDELIERAIDRLISNFTLSMDVSYVNNQIVIKVKEMLANCMGLVIFRLPEFNVEIEEQYHIQRRKLERRLQHVQQMIQSYDKQLANLPENPEEKAAKENQLKTERQKWVDSIVADKRNHYDPIIKLAQNTLYDIRLMLGGRKRTLIEISDQAKNIIALLPKNIRDEFRASPKDISEYFDLYSADPELRQRKDELVKNISDILDVR